MKTLRIAAAQTFEFIDDIEHALRLAIDLSHQAEVEGAKLLCFPEAYLQGYLTEEVSAKRVAIDVASRDFKALIGRFSKTAPTIVMGFIEASQGELFNSAVVVQESRPIGFYRKRHLLPGERFFSAGTDTPVFEVDEVKFGINICYDTNFPDDAKSLATAGASLIVCPANNMMRTARSEALRTAHNSARSQLCREAGLWLLSADVTGGHDDRISLGPTAVINPDGSVVKQLSLGKPGLLVTDISVGI